ncbi:DinB family protein [Hymenobacter sp. PAMC 26628]|uniref:DinB family protein n=1 Tax=Hymenobacter sp. PAMC 26628 TaxID=1484118 RepID=UPI0007704994|nr:DinB family protein [Hymenobacter sp. PAMC 26628]AMJ66521.1 hypothetical protein AXW84_14590 [Hymenobacter sp. PAMC 26628]
MKIEDLIAEINDVLVAAFGQLDEWLGVPEEVRRARPASGGWTIDEILEHVALTNHYLLILIEKGAAKALKNLNDLDLRAELAGYQFNRAQLDQIGLHRSFPWVRPEHMEPNGARSAMEVRQLLHEQLAQCQAVLGRLPNGEGALHRTTMTVNYLGKIDVYQFVYFLAKHAERHLTQMEKAAAELRTPGN